MPRYSIPNVPTAIDFSYQDPGNFCVHWGIYEALTRSSLPEYPYVYNISQDGASIPVTLTRY